MVRTIAFLVVAAAVLTGCVIVRLPENMPDTCHVTVEVNVSGYKSTAGQGNLLEVSTDAAATLPLFGVENNSNKNTHGPNP